MILDDILEKVKERYKDIKDNLDDIKEKASRRSILNPNFFYDSINKEGMNFICEIKKASPSKGIISEDFPYLDIAKEYNQIANAISVLTEPYFFKGSDKILSEVKSVVNIPVLRKDFIIYPYQIYEAKAIGADAVLLIVAILTKEQIKEYLNLAHSLNLGCLVEAHDENEVKIAIEAGAKVIGVNNRNLKDFTINMRNSINLRNLAPKSIKFVSESGIKTREDIKVLEQNDVDAVLIGETLMRSNDRIKMIKELKYDKN
jgi:indole-3-glycerol phosphate synthase